VVLFSPPGLHILHFMEVSGVSLQALPFISVPCLVCAFLSRVYVFSCLPELSSSGSSNWSLSLNVSSNILHINFLVPILLDRPDSLKYRTHCEIVGPHSGPEEDSIFWDTSTNCVSVDGVQHPWIHDNHSFQFNYNCLTLHTYIVEKPELTFRNRASYI
jgi:hypothetical protein